MRLVAVPVVALLSLACGGGGGSAPAAVPTAPSAPSPAPTPPEWTLTGQVVTTVTGAPIPGATVAAGELTASTDAFGRFEFKRATAPGSPLAVTVRSGGYLTRETQVAHPRTSPLAIDVIDVRSPFNLNFYRDLVRNTYEAPQSLEHLHRWTRDAVFYVRTVDSAGRTLEPEVLDILRREIPRGFAAWTSGKYRATVEDGTAERPQATGLVRVSLTRTGGRSCASATIGGNRGELIFNVDNCACGSRKILPDIVWHEVGHIAGFYHVGRGNLMYPFFSADCGRVAQLSDRELHHARVAYERPYGNTDPDSDPDWFTLALPDGAAPPVVTCPGPRSW